MRRVLVVIIVLVAAAAAIVFVKKNHSTEVKPAEEKPAEEGSHLTHDASGRVVVKMDGKTQGILGLLVAKPGAAQLDAELKGYGRVLDPSPLAAALSELAIAQAAAVASSNELARLTILAAQQNASERALQAAQAAALRDQLAVHAARDRLVLAWGERIAARTNLASLVEPLTSQAAALVRIDLSVGETLPQDPAGTRILNLSDKPAGGVFLGAAASVDPQTLGRGAIFFVAPNVLNLVPGEAVTGYIQLPGEPVSGVRIPSQAVVRAEGRGWIYVMSGGGDAFTRTEIPLDRLLEGGWFVSQGVSTNDYVVVTGAQILLSEESKASLKAD